MLILNILSEEINKTKAIDEEEILVRELLELCHSRRDVKIEELSKFNSCIFLKAYKEIYKKGTKSEILLDMVNGTHMLDNLDVIKEFIVVDEEEIY